MCPPVHVFAPVSAWVCATGSAGMRRWRARYGGYDGQLLSSWLHVPGGVSSYNSRPLLMLRYGSHESLSLCSHCPRDPCVAERYCAAVRRQGLRYRRCGCADLLLRTPYASRGDEAAPNTGLIDRASPWARGAVRRACPSKARGGCRRWQGQRGVLHTPQLLPWGGRTYSLRL